MYKFSKFSACLTQNSTKTNQVEILPGTLTQAGGAAPLVDGVEPLVDVVEPTAPETATIAPEA
jgi:hypothetical protein